MHRMWALELDSPGLNQISPFTVVWLGLVTSLGLLSSSTEMEIPPPS